MTNECYICFDKLQKPVSTVCGHHFCKPCMEKWGARAKTCPLCRFIVVEDQIKILSPIYNLLTLIYSFGILSVITSVLTLMCGTESAGHHEQMVAFCVSSAIFVVILVLEMEYSRDFVSRVHAQWCGLTVARLEWIYLLFIWTCLAIYFFPSFAYWWGTAAVLGLVLILHRAWDWCIFLGAFLLCLSCALPLMLQNMTTAVVSALTRVPALCATSIIPLLAHVVVATVCVFVVYAVHQGKCWFAISNGVYLSSDACVSARVILRNLRDQGWMWF